MAAYDSREFSKQFSERTKDNLRFITSVVNKEESAVKFQEDFLNKYDALEGMVGKMEEEIRNEADSLRGMNKNAKNGKNEYRSKLHSVAGVLQRNKKALKSELEGIVSTKMIRTEKIYEVTQLLNSLMGVAVLPYEMHKEILKGTTKNGMELRKGLMETVNYQEFEQYVLGLYGKKWITTYSCDISNGKLCDGIGLHFLTHVRNAVCHSGNDAISILPLDEGKVIEKVLFYDHYSDKKNEIGEFAMRLTVGEVSELVNKIADFYNNSLIGSINKTEQIKKAEKHVNELLGEDDGHGAPA